MGLRWQQQSFSVLKYNKFVTQHFIRLFDHLRYKQVFLNEDSDGELKEYNDSHIFAISLVPIQVLRRRPENNDQDVIWRNELPSSVSLCRPVKLLI